jgi:hypothetical protein
MRLRFTIRDLLWLTLMIGLLAGWLLDRKQLSDKLAMINHAMITHFQQQRAIDQEKMALQHTIENLRARFRREEEEREKAVADQNLENER